MDTVMASIEASLGSIGPASTATAADVDAAMADLKLSLATTAGTADTSSADIAAAMADIGIAVDAVALSLETTMASVDATMSLAAADVAVHAGDMAASMDVVAGAADTADTAFLGLSTGGLAIVAAAVAVIGTGAVLFDLGSKYQDATNKLAAGADFSVNAANKIGTAFTNQAFSTTFSAQSTMEFHSAVACQLGSVAGKALTASQALAVMKSGQDLAGARRPQLERFLLLPSTRARASSAALTAP